MQFIMLLGLQSYIINAAHKSSKFQKFICYHTFILHITFRELFLMVNSLKTMIYFFLYHCNGIFFLYMFASISLYECSWVSCIWHIFLETKAQYKSLFAELKGRRFKTYLKQN